MAPAPAPTHIPEMLAAPLQDWTILVGAGASVPAPSSLPDGARLAGRVFDLLTGTGRLLLDAPALAALRQAVTQELRLEIFLEILAGEIPPHTVFQPFEMLRPAVPNFTHLAIAALSPRTIVTTNQDLLLERAQDLLLREGGGLMPAPQGVLHLHGRCNDIGSIITIISQYLGGLASDVRARFAATVAGAKVLVLGYSGRDRDVMPVLLDARPSCVRWIFHTPTGISRQAPLSDMSPELAHAQKVLGSRLEICCTDTRGWLEAQLTDEQRRRIAALEKGLVRRPLDIPPSVHAAFRRIGVLPRNHALAQILEQFGDYPAALNLYQALLREGGGTHADLLLHFGRATTRVAGHEAGRKVFLSLLERRDVSPTVRAHALLNAIDALRNTSRPVEATRELARLEALLPTLERGKDYWQLLGWMLIARAGIDRIEGCAKAAYRLYARAQHAFLQARDIDGVIDAETWKAESALMLGNFREALALADEALRDAAAYGKSLVKAWPRYVKGECLALSGRCDAAMPLAQEAKEIFDASGNIQGPLWSLILASDCLRQISWRNAYPVLSELHSRAPSRRLAHVKVRIELEAAEIARAAGNWRHAAQAIATVRSLLRDKAAFTRQPRLLLAHALLVQAECARSRRHPDAVRLLRRARSAYRRLDARAFVARADVALFLAGARDIRLSRLLPACRREGYGHELARLKRRGFYPVHFV